MKRDSMPNEENQRSAASLRFRAEYEGAIDIALTVSAGLFGIATANPAGMGLAVLSAWNAASKMNRSGEAIRQAVQRENSAPIPPTP